AARFKLQREAVYVAWRGAPLCGTGYWRTYAKVVVTLTHVGRRMDSDNLAGAFKAVRDEIADNVGTDDGSAFFEWRYEQRTGEPGVARARPGTAGGDGAVCAGWADGNGRDGGRIRVARRSEACGRSSGRDARESMSNVTRFPLAWPAGRPRTNPNRRTKALFH